MESLSITLQNQERRLTLVIWRGDIVKKPSKLDDYEDFDKLSSSGCSGKPPLKKPRKVLFEVNLDPPKSLNSVDLSTSSVEESDDENNDADNEDLDGSVALARWKQKVAAKKQANGFSRPNRNTENKPHKKTGYKPKTIHKPLKENKKKAATPSKSKNAVKKAREETANSQSCEIGKSLNLEMRVLRHGYNGSGSVQFNLCVSPSLTFGTLRKELSQMTGISPANQLLIIKGKEWNLEDHKLITTVWSLDDSGNYGLQVI